MALGKDRQRNMRQEGFELLVERGSGIILGGKSFSNGTRLLEEKPEQGLGRLGVFGPKLAFLT